MGETISKCKRPALNVESLLIPTLWGFKYFQCHLNIQLMIQSTLIQPLRGLLGLATIR